MSSIADLLAIVNGNPEKTLDELILEIDNRKRFVVGDTTLIPATSKTTADGQTSNYFSFTPSLSGQVTLDVTYGSSVDPSKMILKIARNGTAIVNTSMNNIGTSKILNIEAGYKYEFKISRDGWTSGSEVTLSITGDIKVVGYYDYSIL